MKCRPASRSSRCRPPARSCTRWKPWAIVIQARVATARWATLAALAEAMGEELRPIYEGAERVRSLVSHGWLINEVNNIAAMNSATTR